MGEPTLYQRGRRYFWSVQKGITANNYTLVTQFTKHQYEILKQVMGKDFIVLPNKTSFPVKNIFNNKEYKEEIFGHSFIWDSDEKLITTSPDNILVATKVKTKQQDITFYEIYTYKINNVIFKANIKTQYDVFEKYGQKTLLTAVPSQFIINNQYSVFPLHALAIPREEPVEDKHNQTINILVNNHARFGSDKEAKTKKTIHMDLFANQDAVLSNEFFNFNQSKGYFIEIYDPNENPNSPTPVAIISYKDEIVHPLMIAKAKQGTGASYVIKYDHFIKSKSGIIFQTHEVNKPTAETFKVRVLDKEGNDLTGYRWEIHVKTKPAIKEDNLAKTGQKNYWQLGLNSAFRELINEYDTDLVNILQKIYDDKAVIVRSFSATSLENIFKRQMGQIKEQPLEKLDEFQKIKKKTYEISSDNYSTKLYSCDKEDQDAHVTRLKTAWESNIFVIAPKINKRNNETGDKNIIANNSYLTSTLTIKSDQKTFKKQVIIAKKYAPTNGLIFDGGFIYIYQNYTSLSLGNIRLLRKLEDRTLAPFLPEGDQKNYSITVKAGDDFLIPTEMFNFNNPNCVAFKLFDATENPNTPRPLAIVSSTNDYCNALSITDAAKDEGATYIGLFNKDFIKLKNNVVCRTSKNHPTLLTGKKLTDSFTITPLNNRMLPLTEKGRTVTITVMP